MSSTCATPVLLSLSVRFISSHWENFSS